MAAKKKAVAKKPKAAKGKKPVANAKGKTRTKPAAKAKKPVVKA